MKVTPRTAGASLLALHRLLVIMPLAVAVASCSLEASNRSISVDVELQSVVPAAVGSDIMLTVDGPGMDPLNRSFPPGTTQAELAVPAGTDRTFAVEFRTATATLSGSATINVIPGGRHQLTLAPTLREARYVLADTENGRIVQIDDFNGKGWRELTAAEIAAVTAFRPTDLELGPQARLYIANGDSAANPPNDYIIRVDDITGSGAQILYDDPDDAGIEAIAIDHNNAFIYWIAQGSDKLRRIKLDGTGFVEQTLPVTFGVAGLAVDQGGRVLMIYNTGPAVPQTMVAAWDPVAQTFRASPALGSYLTPKDVHVIGSAIYAAYWDGMNSAIVQLSYDPGSGTFTTVNSLTTPGYLGPEKFFAHHRSDINFTEADCTDGRITRAADISGTGFATYGVSGSGQGQFFPGYGGGC